MIVKSPSIRIRMTSMGLWSLEGTPGILEVFTNVTDPTLEDQEGDEGSSSPVYKRAEVATKLLETLENFNYDDTEERSDAYFSGWLDSDEKVIDLPIFEDFQQTLPATSPSNPTPPLRSGNPPPPLVPVTRPCNPPPLVPVTPHATNNNVATGFNQGHVKVGYESSPLWNADYPTSLYSPPAVPEPAAHSISSPGGWSPHTMDQLAGVSCTLTPPTSPHMYSPKRCEEIQKLDDFLNPETLAPVAVAGEKESGQLILSFLAEMNQTEIDEIMKNQFGGGAGGVGANNDADFTMAEEGAYGSNGLNSSGCNSNDLLYGGEISPVDTSCASSVDGFTMGGKSLAYEGLSSPVGANDSSCHSFSEASMSNFDYTEESESSETSDPDYSPYSPPGDKGGRKTAQKLVASGRGSVAGSGAGAGGARNGVGGANGAQASTAGGRKEPTAKRSRGAAAKPYARKSVAPEDKKLRKKEQNKNAATRYRIKKKQEVEVILGEEKGLEDKNVALVKQVEDLQREISFMKKFMRDFFKTQGRLK
uniref:Activating transcription factor of chaperone n=1 Tax=Cacopsylla melanoneura TaxID=428564 RepID=A0A8D8X7E4_9HEMI